MKRSTQVNRRFPRVGLGPAVFGSIRTESDPVCDPHGLIRDDSSLVALVDADQLQADSAGRIRIHVRVLPRSGTADRAPSARLVYVKAKFLECRNRFRQVFD